MFRALVWKEWRQLRLIRWGSVALGTILPLAFAAGSSLADRGLLPTYDLKIYALRDLMFEVLPAAIGVALWPLVAVMSATQTFAGDRQAGTERFLLERPVPRATIWWSRGVASAASTAAGMLGAAAAGLAAAVWMGPPPGIGWTRWEILLGGGIPVSVLAWLGGALAGSILSAPLAAVLLGVLLGAMPVLLAGELGSNFPFAAFGAVPIGTVLPLILLPAYLVASATALTRGEPAGRGRLKRVGVVLGVALVVVLASFLVLAPIAVRSSVRAGEHGLEAAPTGATAAIINSGGWRGTGGYMVDVVSGAKLRFLPPPVLGAAWSSDGKRLAVVTLAGTLGSESKVGRIEVYDERGAAAGAPVDLPHDRWGFAPPVWDGNRLLVFLHDRGRKDNRFELFVCDLAKRTWHATGFFGKGGLVTLVGPLGNGHVLVREVVPASAPAVPAEEVHPDRYDLRPVDLASLTVGAPLATLSGEWVWAYGTGASISPSGRFVLVRRRGESAGSVGVLDLTASPPSEPRWLGSSPVTWANWMEGDRLVWVEKRDEHGSCLVARLPGDADRVLRSWVDAVIGFQRSPDAKRLFVSVLPSYGTGRSASEPGPSPGPTPLGVTAQPPEELIYDVAAGELKNLGRPFSPRANDRRFTLWAGPTTLARVAPDVVAFEDLASLGTLRFPIGGASDLRGSW